jgi:hypothetical protein
MKKYLGIYGLILLLIASFAFAQGPGTGPGWIDSSGAIFSPAVVNPGHKHSESWASDGSPLVRSTDQIGNVFYGPVDITASTSLSGTITAIGSTAGDLSLAQTSQAGGGLTIPATLRLKAPKGATITVATGTTFTVNGPFEAGLYQVFSCTGTGAVVGLKEVCPEWFGAITGGTVDCATAINTAATVCRALFDLGQVATIKFSPGIYLALSGLDLSSCNISMDPKAIIRSGISSGAAVTIGESVFNRINYQQETRNFARDITLEVEQNGTFPSTASQPTYAYTVGTIGIKINHLDRSIINIRRCAGFETGVSLSSPSGAGIAYNKFYIGYLRNNINLLINTSASTVQSTNQFYGGSFNCPTTGANFIGVKFTTGSSASTRHMNNNVFYSPTFELGRPGGGKFSYCVYFDNELVANVGAVINNKFYDVYVENCDYGVRWGDYTAENEFEAAYISASGFILSVPSSTASYQNYAVYKPQEAKKHEKVLVANPNLVGGIMVSGVYYPRGLSALSTYFGAIGRKMVATGLGPDYVKLYTDGALGYYVDVSQYRRFRLVRKIKSGTNYGRTIIRCFDENFTALTGTSPYYVSPTVYTNMSVDTSILWDAGSLFYYGGATISTDDFTFHTSVKYAWIGVGYEQNALLQGFSLWAYLPEALRPTVTPFVTINASPRVFLFPQVISNPDNSLFSPSKPTSGVFQVGEQANNLSAASGQPPFWVVVNRKDTAIRIQANATDTTIEVVSTTGILATDVIGIMLDNGTCHWTSVAGITDADTLVITDGIPASRNAPIGAIIFTNRWAAAANLP